MSNQSPLTPQQKWRKNNPEKCAIIRKKYYDANREKIAAQTKERRLAGKTKKYVPGSSRGAHYKAKYGITAEQYDQMVIDCGNVCAICQLPERIVRNGEIAPLCVDHCHETKTVRGLLCMTCNSALGKFKDSEEVLGRAISYLQKGKDY